MRSRFIVRVVVVLYAIGELMSDGSFLAAISAGISAIAVLVAVYNARKTLETSRLIHNRQMQLSQRQTFISIWPSISKLRNVDPDADPATQETNVVEAVNALELVAVCSESDAVDTDLIMRVFGDPFLVMYDNIGRVRRIPSIGKSGADLLRENPAIEDHRSRILSYRQKQLAVRAIRNS